MKDFSKLQEMLQGHGGKILGALLGLALGTGILLFGFLQTLFVILCGMVGIVVGKQFDDKSDMKAVLEKIIPPAFKR
jgi:uncharacterized membrane protein